MTLWQNNQQIYNYVTPGGFEIDFYLSEKGQLIQVAQQLRYAKTRERELRAIEDTDKKMKIKKAIILSDSSEDSILANGIPTKIQSVTEWLMFPELGE